MASEFGPQLKYPLGHPIETARNEAREKMVTRKIMCLLQLKDKHDDTKNDTAIVVCQLRLQLILTTLVLNFDQVAH